MWLLWCIHTFKDATTVVGARTNAAAIQADRNN